MKLLYSYDLMNGDTSKQSGSLQNISITSFLAQNEAVHKGGAGKNAGVLPESDKVCRIMPERGWSRAPHPL